MVNDGGKAAQREQPADRDEIAWIVMSRLDDCGSDQRCHDKTRSSDDEADGEQQASGRQRRGAAEPADYERPEPLPD